MPRIQHKRGTSANLTSVNPTPLAGELVWDSSENAIKIGDGTTAWTSLAYVTATPRTHTHSADAITSGTIDYARLPVGSTASTVCAGDDARLTDARTPTAHKSTHATGGSDALAPSDIGAAPAASPTFTGTVTVSGVRPLKLYGDANDAAVKRGGTGGWAFAYAAEGSSGTYRGGYGFFGTADALTYYWIGSAFNTATVYVTATGVGIGASRTSPATALDVNGVITVAATSGSAGSYLPSLTFSGDANTGFGQVSGQSDSASVFTAGHERVRVDSSGRVGIGTSSPGYPLDVAGGFRFRSGTQNQMVIGADFNGTSITNGVLKIGGLSVPHFNTDQKNVGVILGGSTSTDNTIEIGGNSSTLNSATSIRFYTAATTTSGIGTRRMVIDGSGNVGIGTGTTSPASRLDVNGVITVSATSGSNGTYAASVCFSSDPDTGLGQVGGTNTCSLIGSGFEVLRASNDSISVFRPLNHRFLNLQTTSNYDICGDFSGFSFFYGTTSATSKPPGADHAVTTLSYSTEWQFQDAADWRTNARYVRGQQAGVWSAWSRLYADNYHPEADKWTTARTLTLTGAISGSVSIDGSGNVSLATSFTNPITETYVNVGNTGTAKTIALTSGTVQNFTLTGNCTFTMPTATAGQSFTLMLRTGAGSYTATFTGVKWPGSTPVVTTTASRMDLFTFVSDGTNWYGNVVQGYTP